MTSEEKVAEMDRAAEIADAELRHMDQFVTIPMARWMRRHLALAGYKRLGRLMTQLAKETEGLDERSWATKEDQEVVSGRQSGDVRIIGRDIAAGGQDRGS